MRRLLIVFFAMMLVLTGCFGGAGTDATSKTDGAAQNSPKLVNAASLTVLDIKKKYGAETDKSLMPMYNVERDEVFTFKFKSKFEDQLPSEIISVHTDVKALEQSKILASINFTSFSEADTLEVKSLDSILTSYDTAGGLRAGWGNAPIYYIRINYDLDASTPTKLEKPIIVPFTIKSELPVPTLRSELMTNGDFKLVWDEVEGATSYRVYNRNTIGDLLTIENLPVNGPEEGYAGGYPNLTREVEETELTYFMTYLEPDKPDPEYQTVQNSGVNGEYYVTAVSGDKESNFSNVATTYEFSSRLPSKWTGNFSFEDFNDISELPITTEVTYIDGSTGMRNIIYDSDIEISEYGTRVGFSIEGTIFRGYVFVRNMTEADIAKLNEGKGAEASSGFIEPKNTTDYVPSPDVPTIIEEADAETKQAEPGSITDNQINNTEKKVEEGNKKTVNAPELVKDVEINADSAVEEYLALSMMNAEEEISLMAFPEVQNFEVLSDVLKKAMYQNPLVLGVDSFGYDYSTLTLKVRYEDSAESIKKKQEEIIAEAKKIVSSTIQADMSVEQKHKAIYDYLNDHTKYDDDALANAEANEFKEVDPKYYDSFTTYGIMVKKVGVCASYASVYKLLSDMAGMESVVVTGDMRGIPHAWNKVKLDNGWVHVDATNNETNSGIPYLLFNTSDETARSLQFTVNKDFWLDSEISQFVAKDDSKDYYKANGLEVTSASEFGTKLSEAVKGGKSFIALRLAGRVDEDTLMDEAVNALKDLPQDKLENAIMGSLSNYIYVQY